MEKNINKNKRKIGSRATILLIINIIECIVMLIIVIYLLRLIIGTLLSSSESEDGLHTVFMVFLGGPLIIFGIIDALFIPPLILEIFRLIGIWKDRNKDDYVKRIKKENYLLLSTEMLPILGFIFNPKLPNEFIKYLKYFGVIILIRIITFIIILRIKSLKDKIKEIEQNNIDENKIEEKIEI